MSETDALRAQANTTVDTRIDRWMLIAMLAILVAGSMTVYSASSPYAMRTGAPSSLFLSHLEKVVIGLLAFLAAAKMDYHRWERLALPLLVLFGTLMVFANTSVNESERWIEILGFRFQPSEGVKFAVVMFLAGHLSRIQDFRREKLRLGLALLPVGAVLVELMSQPNYSMLMVIGATTVLMLFLAGIPLAWFAAVGAAGVLGVIALLSQGDFHSDRVDKWLESFASMNSSTDQVMQSFIGFGRGGLTGQSIRV